MTILIHLFLGWLIADFLSGFVHWVEDRLLPEGLPILDDLVVQPNILHHEKPNIFLLHNIWQRNWTAWLVVILVAIPWYLIFGFGWIFLGALLGGFAASEVHARAHFGYDNPEFIRVLQRIGFIQSPAEHARHHRGNHDRCYCVLTNYCNPVLDAFDLWSALEFLLSKMGMQIKEGR